MDLFAHWLRKELNFCDRVKPNDNAKVMDGDMQ